MKFITTDTNYALRALTFMAKRLPEKKKIITVDDIASDQRLPYRFLRRILQKLAEKNMLSSYKGQGGGFSFLKTPDQIKFIDIIKIFQGGIDFANCHVGQMPCPETRGCLLRKELEKINLLVAKMLKDVTVASLLRKVDRPGRKNSDK